MIMFDYIKVAQMGTGKMQLLTSVTNEIQYVRHVMGLHLMTDLVEYPTIIYSLAQIHVFYSHVLMELT